MKGIFKTLFDLLTKSSSKPLEDFLTEIFAYVLSCNEEIMNDFLRDFKIISGEIEDFTISTQFVLKALDNHVVDSRPDIAIFGKDIAIFFENKINATEGIDQLSRYAEHLEGLNREKSKLVYITRDYDCKNASDILRNCLVLSQNDLIQIRWYEVALFLKRYRTNTYVRELLTFMKQIRISMNNQFTPLDLLTLSNFSNVRKIMDEILFGEIYTKFKKVNGNNTTQPTTCVTQLKSNDRYIYYANHKGKIQVLLGFWMNSVNEKEYPEVGIKIQLSPSSGIKDKWRVNFKKIEDSYSGWETESLSNPNAWCGVSKKKSLQSFLSSENHVTGIKSFLHGCIAELEKIINEFSLLEDSHA